MNEKDATRVATGDDAPSSNGDALALGIAETGYFSSLDGDFKTPPAAAGVVDRRVGLISVLAVVVAVAAAIVAQLLMALIGLVTNLSFYGRASTAFASPAGNKLGLFVIAVPALGGIVVGFMARYGSEAIRGHGIPEAMEQILLNQSRVAPRLTLLKPISSAIAIGTGGPFGAEGLIIATGGALGSLLAQLMRTTAEERKVLLAAGAAAGMAATFGSPVAAVLLAMELLLFEFRPRSLIPVALASATATAVRYAMVGSSPIFPLTNVAAAGPSALAAYVGLGAVVGFAAIWITRLVYAVEDSFDKLPIHWMWWPALGGLAVGVIGYFAPRTLGVGYDNIEGIVSGQLGLRIALILCVMKLISWAIALGSGTSGGTLAPLFTIGGGLGALLGTIINVVCPAAGIDVRVAALVGMAALFAGASRALLASVVFALETTLQPHGLLPLLGGCTASYFVSCLLLRQTIMTEKIARRGVRVPSEYAADFLDQIKVSEVASLDVVSLVSTDTVAGVREWLNQPGEAAHHQGYPVLDERQRLLGVVTRRDLLDSTRTGPELLREIIHRPPAVVFIDSSLREAADHMVRENVGRLPVVAQADRGKVIGMITRGDLLCAHKRRLDETHLKNRSIRLGLRSSSER